VLLFIRTQKTSPFSLIRALTGAEDWAASMRQISTPSTSSIRVRVRITTAWLSAWIRCVVSHTKPSAFGGLTVAVS
jgi:hypothetical protein